MRSGVQLDFSKKETGGKVGGFFTETAVLGMLEAKDYDHIDFVSHFFW